MLTMLGISASALWGGFWAFVRDQDGPDFGGAGPSNKWKEAGIAASGTPFLISTLMAFGLTIDAAIAAAASAALTSVAWSLRHSVIGYLFFWVGRDRFEHSIGLEYRPGRDGTQNTAMAYANLAVGGALVTLGPGVALVWFGHPFLAALALLCGAAKAGAYKVGWLLRPVPGRRPEPTFIGHVLHGVIAIGGAAGCILVAGG